MVAFPLSAFVAAGVEKPALPVQVRECALRTFKHAIFFKPREGSIGGLEEKLAPLIVQEAAASASSPNAAWRSGDYFGLAVSALRYNQIRAAADPSRPTIYAQQSDIIINNTPHKQMSYIWLYPTWPQGELTALTEFFGVRITLGVNGMPLVWEAISRDAGTSLLSGSEKVAPGFFGGFLPSPYPLPERERGYETAPTVRVVFVAESLEEAAKDEFGDPLPGCTFAIERGLDETPDVSVVRVISDGPIPFGPYVYLSARGQGTPSKPPVARAPGSDQTDTGRQTNDLHNVSIDPGDRSNDHRDITTVLCRCSPSQVLEFTDTAYFDIRPANQLIPLALHAAAWPLLIELRAVPLPTSDKHAQQSPDEFLRWPTVEPH